MPRMKELIEAGLFGRGLYQVTDQEQVDRYNACLEDLGQEPTNLLTFSIDRFGWSPEIAAEKGDDYYLSHGEANPLAIILTPEQRHAPIYFPMHSFDWKLMDEWFKTHEMHIDDITKETAIWLDIDQEVDVYDEAQDLLMVDDVMVEAHAPNKLMERAEAQQQLVKEWLTNPSAHVDAELVNSIEETARSDGDFRRRHFVIKDMQFTDVNDFYTRAFGGIFVLRSQNSEPLLFARDKERNPQEDVLPADESALDVLHEHGYISIDFEWWKDHLANLQIVAESFLIEILDELDPEIDFASLNEAKRKKVLSKHSGKLKKSYLKLSRTINAIKTGELPSVSERIRQYLYHPSSHLPPSTREVVWQLLTYIRGGRLVPLMYRHQKTAFIEAFTKSWRKPRRTWAIARIKEHYDLASKSSGYML